MATKVPTARDLAPPTTNVPTAPPIINDTYQAIPQVHVNSSRSIFVGRHLMMNYEREVSKVVILNLMISSSLVKIKWIQVS